MRIALPARLDAASLATRDRQAPVVSLSGESMGTCWSLHYAAGVLPVATVRASVERLLADIVQQMSHWEPASELSRFNRAPAGTSVGLGAHFSHVMHRSLQIAAFSEGAFDPAIGHLVDLWGFGPGGARPAPTPAEIGAARRCSGWQRLRYDAATGRLWQPGGVALDLSGVAKGYAADAVAEALQELGIGHALVEIGGELVGSGVRPDGDPWWVDLEIPPGIQGTPLRVALHGLAVATSGNYRRGAHTIDPRNGEPAHGVVSVSVVAETALVADALATALGVLGPEAGQTLAGEQIAARFLLPDGREILTSALAAMLA